MSKTRLLVLQGQREPDSLCQMSGDVSQGENLRVRVITVPHTQSYPLFETRATSSEKD